MECARLLCGLFDVDILTLGGLNIEKDMSDYSSCILMHSVRSNQTHDQHRSLYDLNLLSKCNLDNREYSGTWLKGLTLGTEKNCPL